MEHDGSGLLAEIAFGTEANAMLDGPVMACLAGFVGGIRAVIWSHAGDDLRTAQLLAAANIRELEPMALPMAWRIDCLWETGRDQAPDATDGFAVGRAYAKARLQVADVGMRAFLRHGAVRAFDPHLYPRGETLRLLGLVPQLRRVEIEALHSPGRMDGAIRRRLLEQELLGDQQLSAIGELLRDLVAPVDGQVPGEWVPPWDRTVPLSTE